MRRRLFGCLLALALTLSLCACGGSRQVEQDDGRLQVVCSLFPYYDFVRQIGGEYVSPILLVPAGREVHSFEPTPRDVLRLAQADILICNGGVDEQWVEEIVSSAIENIPSVVRMMDFAPLLEEEVVEGMETAVHHHHHDEDCEHHHGHEGETVYDEHIWTSPKVAAELCRAVCETLSAADEAHRQQYEENLAAYLTELNELDEAFRQTVAAGRRQTLVFGDRFPLLYFCAEYDLRYSAAFHGCAGDTEPSLHTMKYLIDKVAQQKIPVVYTIELSSQKIAQAVAEATGARVLTFHSCQTVSRQEFDEGVTYAGLMWQNVAALKEGLA